MKKNVFVIKGEGEWKLQVGSSVVSTYQKQGDAAEAGKSVAKSLGTDLVIQGRDGRFRSKDSYGRDPNPPKDREH